MEPVTRNSELGARRPSQTAAYTRKSKPSTCAVPWEGHRAKLVRASTHPTNMDEKQLYRGRPKRKPFSGRMLRQNSLGRIGQHWAESGTAGQNWAGLGRIGQLWAGLGSFGQLWAEAGRLREVFARSAPEGRLTARRLPSAPACLSACLRKGRESRLTQNCLTLQAGPARLGIEHRDETIFSETLGPLWRRVST